MTVRQTALVRERQGKCRSQSDARYLRSYGTSPAAPGFNPDMPGLVDNNLHTYSMEKDHEQNHRTHFIPSAGGGNHRPHVRDRVKSWMINRFAKGKAA